MIPDDPLGKNGPHLDIFLRKDNRYVLPYLVRFGPVTSFLLAFKVMITYEC